MSVSAELNDALRKFVKNYGVPLSKLSIKLGVAPEEILQWWVDEKKRIPVHKILQLTKILGASEEDFILDRLHSVAVDVGVLGFSKSISSRYADNAFSFVKSSKHIVEFIMLRYGNLVANSVLYKLGVSPSYFDDTNNRISIRFYEDLLREYISLGNSYEDLYDLSKCMFLTIEEEPEAHKFFPKCRRYDDAFTHLHHAMTIFEENFDYDFQVWRDHVRIITKPSQKLVESMKDKRYGSRELYQYRSAVFGHMVILFGLPPLPQRTLKCVSQGDSASVYEIEYPSGNVLGRYHMA